MPDEKISQLTSGVPAQGADILPIARPSAPGVAYSVTAQSIANLSSSTPGGSNNTIQGNKSGVFSGIPGTVADFVNGLITITPPGTGVALSVTGDASGSNIVNFYSNGVSSPTAFFIDTFGNTTINSQGTGLGDTAAFNIYGDDNGDDLAHFIAAGGTNSIIFVQTDPDIAIQLNNTSDASNVYISPKLISLNTPGASGIAIGPVGTSQPILYIFNSLTANSTSPYGAITIWGSPNSDIQQWNINSNVSQLGSNYKPNAKIDSTGSLHLSQAIYDSTGSAGTTGQVLTSEVGSVGSPPGQVIKWVTPSTTTRTTAIQYVIDGGGSIVGTGLKGQINMPIGGTITGWTLTADQPGSAVIDVLRSTYANFSTTVSIVGSGNGPNLSGVQKNQSLSLSGWTSITLNQNDEVQFNVISASSVMRLNLTINMTVSG